MADAPIFETEMLRRTLLELLKENEQLRRSLQLKPAEPLLKPAVIKPEQEPASLPVRAKPVGASAADSLASRGVVDIEKRQRIVERYREKRKRRIEATPHLKGPRNMKYTKMSAVADGKRRNSAGKFVKKVPDFCQEGAGNLNESCQQLLVQ